LRQAEFHDLLVFPREGLCITSRGRRGGCAGRQFKSPQLQEVKNRLRNDRRNVSVLNGPAQGRQQLRSRLSHVGSDATTKAAACKLQHMLRPPLSS
jgi:hypothetical protein